MDTSILGIDVSSRKLDLCWSHRESCEHTTIAYTSEALDAFVVSHPSLQPDTCVVGVESTGEYHFHVSQYFLKRGFTVKVINPILTRHYTRLTIRGTKTDEKDSELICKLLRDGHGEVISLASVTNRSKEMLRLAQHLSRTATQLAQRIGSTQRKDLPDTATAERKVERIISKLRMVAAELVAEVTDQPSREEQLIRSIPGFGPKLAAIVYHELGDIHRFRNGKCLVAFAGLDPRIRQSGLRLHSTGRLTKRGSPMLRHALFIAANVAKRCDPELRAYYLRKRAEGRHHAEAVCIISRKLLYRINALIRENRTYSPQIHLTER
jgi:transposase